MNNIQIRLQGIRPIYCTKFTVQFTTIATPLYRVCWQKLFSQSNVGYRTESRKTRKLCRQFRVVPTSCILIVLYQKHRVVFKKNLVFLFAIHKLSASVSRYMYIRPGKTGHYTTQCRAFNLNYSSESFKLTLVGCTCKLNCRVICEEASSNGA